MGRKKKNQVYRYFSIAKENCKSTCLVCSKTLNTIHGANLTKHLKHAHKKEYNEIEALNKSFNNDINSTTDNTKIIKKECTDLVTVHGRPLALINDKAFQNILSIVPNLNIKINSINIRENIYNTAASLRMDIANKLRQKMICIKVDIASLSNRSFMGVNAQYAENGKIVLKNLAMVELYERHTAEHLKEKIHFILQRFRIGLEHVLCFTTDNGSNMLKMGQLISHELAASCESTTNVGQNMLQSIPQEVLQYPENEVEPGTSQEDDRNHEDSGNLQEVPQDDGDYAEPGTSQDSSLLENVQKDLDSESYVSESETYEFDADAELDSEENAEENFTESVTTALLLGFDDQIIGQRNIGVVRCAAHTLQLAVLKTCEDARIKDIIAKARNVVKRLLSQTYVNIIRANKKKLPVLDCVTRWNSTADMIDRLLYLRTICDEDSQTFLDPSVWETLQEYLNSLSPAKNLLKALQAEQLTLGDLYIKWLLCKIELKNIHSPLSLLLIKNMTDREQVLFENDPFLNALFLDPRVNSTLSEEQQEIAKKNLVDLHLHLRTNIKIIENNGEDNFLGESDTAEDRMTTNFKRARLELDDFLGSKYIEKHDDVSVLMVRNANSRPNSTLSIQREMEAFLKEPLLQSTANIFNYWESKKNTYPLLYELAQVVLATPASQVSVERLFSSLKFVVTKYRCNLKSDLIENIIFLRNNALYENK